MRSSFAAVCLLVALAAGVAAAPASAGAPDPCALAAKTDVLKSFGGSVKAHAKHAGLLNTKCTWTITGTRIGGSGRLVVEVTTDPTFASATYKAAKANDGKPISILGLPALFVPNADAVDVLVHGKLLTVSFVVSGFSASTERALIALATVAARHL